MRWQQAVFGATMVMVPAVAGAQTVSGLYIGAGAGANLRIASGYSLVRQNGNTGGQSFASDIGAVGVVSLGYGFGNGLRTELEGNYRYNDVSRFKVGTRTAAPHGYNETYGGMVNVLYDFDLRRFGIGSPIVPYIGVGVGVGVSDPQAGGNDRFTAGSLALTDQYRLRSASAQFAYQAIIGGAYSLDSVLPGLALTTEYRFYGTTEARESFRDTATLSSGSTPLGTAAVRFPVHVENYNHSFLVGLRYAFNRPAPAPIYVPEPPPVAVRQVARTYLVFFDWNRADLTDRARQIIADAAGNSRTAGTTRLEVAGHADRSGTPAYNLRLSQRRAETVAAELMRDGVSRSQIVTEAFGESRPLVPTADGVREPQNRRVEIVLR